MVKMVSGFAAAAAALMVTGATTPATALASGDDVPTPAGRVYSLDESVYGERVEIRFEADGDFQPDGAGGRTASGHGYFERQLMVCTARVDLSWQIRVDSDGAASTELSASRNQCAQGVGLRLPIAFGDRCTDGWDDLQPGETGPACWIDATVTREQ